MYTHTHTFSLTVYGIYTGTHFYASTVQGGVATSRSGSDSSFTGSSSDFYLQLNAKLAYHEATGEFGGGFEKTKYSSTFSSSSETESRLRGGRPAFDPSDIKQWSAWADTIKDIPIPVSYRLWHIAELAPLNSALQRNLIRAVDEYISVWV